VVRDATLADLEVVASWVRTADDCRMWAGPAVSFPLRLDRLAAEIGFAEAENLVLGDEAAPDAFGQVAPKDGGRGHLARVIVRPDARGRGLGCAIVSALVERASAQGVRVASLNVYATNTAARHVYEVAGFVAAPWPEDDGTAPPGVLHLRLAL
jgi:[ribosomal protein S18]-alanine N-acetyltransferase